MRNTFSKADFIVRILNRFDPFVKGINRGDDPKAGEKSQRLRVARNELANQSFRANDITDAEIDAVAQAAIESADSSCPDKTQHPAQVAAVSDFPTATINHPTSPQSPDMEYAKAINSLASRVTALETQLAALKGEGAPQQKVAQAANTQTAATSGKLTAELAAISDPAKRTAFMQQHSAGLMTEARRNA